MSLLMSSVVGIGGVGCRKDPDAARGTKTPEVTDIDGDDERIGDGELGPKDAVSEVARALARGEAAAALEIVDAGLARAPDDARLHLARGAVLQELRRGDDAIEAWQRALTLEPSLFGALDGIGTVHLDNGRAKEAVVFFRRALDIRPDFAAGQYNYALALRQLGDLARALEAMARARALEPGDPEILLEHASMLESAGRVEEARATVHEAAARAPGDAWVQMIYGDVLTAERAARAEVLGAYRAAVRLEPTLGPARARLLRMLLPAGELEEAAAVTAMAVERAPEDASAWSDQAAVQHAGGDLQAALASLERSLNLDPAGVAAHRRRVYGALGRCEEALVAVDAMATAGLAVAQVERARDDFETSCP
jgi:tetratricopeptide (TPR) repeat protein